MQQSRLKKAQILLLILVAVIASVVFVKQILENASKTKAAATDVVYELDPKNITLSQSGAESSFSVKIWATAGNGSGVQMATVLLKLPDFNKAYFASVENTDDCKSLPETVLVAQGAEMMLTRFTKSKTRPAEQGNKFCLAKINFTLRANTNPSGQTIAFKGLTQSTLGYVWQAVSFDGASLGASILDGFGIVTLGVGPTPTPYAGEPAPVCTSHSNCGTRPYYVLVERKDQENKPIYDLRYYDVNEELPSDTVYSVVSNGIVIEPPTTIASGEFLLNAAPFRYATIPFQYLFRVKMQDTTTAKNMKIYVGSANMTAPPWTIKTEEQGGITYKVFLRPGLTEIITSTPTRTPTATPTPEGFNLYIDPVGTDPEKEAVELRLETGVRQGARRGERFSMRIVASPKNTDFRSEYIFLKEVKVPVQYALPVNPNSIILESIKTTNNAQCVDYRLDDPQEDEIGTVSAFYLRAVFKSNTPKQLAADTCIAEFTFDVKDNAQFNDSATVKLLTEGESEGIGEVDTVPAMMGMHALAYHLVRNAPTTTPAVTPATIHPKVNLSYDMANRSKTVTVDTSRSVAPSAPDLIIQTIDLIRTSSLTPTACGPVNIRVVVKNQGQSAADPFSISVNGQKKASTQSEPEVSNGGLGVGAVKTYYFDKIKFNADGPNTIFVDSEDKVIEFREDNNYINKKFVFADIPGNTNTQCPNPTNTPTNTPTPTSLTPTPTYVPDPNKINLVLMVKLQGVGTSTFSQQFSRLKFGVAIGGGKLESNTEYIYNDFVYKGDGKYEGVISFDPTEVAVGGGYRIIVKGPKHLAKRFCVAAPTGGYAYFCPANTASIALKKGINNFDFTNVQLIAGDIPNGEQDGVVDSSDLAFIRDNLGIKLPEIIKIGDLNLDGIIDTQDYSMVINNLVNNEDEN